MGWYETHDREPASSVGTRGGFSSCEPWEFNLDVMLVIRCKLTRITDAWVYA
ncbi:hypothetical protein RRSWK_04951 [Rhodopirellula sp. SWK7]|nr:hypothetical protein RRSWK_04951 [Rhodopirellula sp. SWK7]